MEHSAGDLSPATRTHTLERMAFEELDVLVIGGGVVGDQTADAACLGAPDARMEGNLTADEQR